MGTLLQRWIFGQVSFQDNEEFDEFRFRFLMIVLLAGAVCTGLLIVGDRSSINRIAPLHVRSMLLFTLCSMVLWWLLRSHKERFLPVAVVYETICLLEYVSALIFVSEDELRVLWFMTNIPGVYILLGQRAGAFITGLTLVGLAWGNRYLAAPYSPNALATLLTSIAYTGVFFHFYGARSISYFVRMRQSYERVLHMATHDPLTGVLNARAYYATCDQLIELAKRQRTPYTVLFVDLDHFKAINNTHGHAAGDLVVQAVALALQQGIRASDALGRIGGEEFSIFLPHTDLTSASRLAETLRQTIQDLMPAISAAQRIRITASIGVARNQHSDQTMLAIQQQADQAMYLAKSQGRNRVSCFAEQEAGLQTATGTL